MPTDHRERLRAIRRFDQLVDYLRHALGWPIDSDDFEELTFEYDPQEELGIDAKNAAKIQEIKRLRPLAPGQPWGIFFVKFQPKRLPVVALRRILGQVALKKRASDHSSERQAWAADDLLFVSNYGEGQERRIAFAHFSKPPDGHDLPTLKVLGWDNLDTALHLDAVARELTDHLTWPDDEDDAAAWREQWRAAFTLRHHEVITTSKELSERLAALACAIRDRTKTALAIESETGPLTKLMKAFQTALVHDLDEADFADMYAQTIAYGLLSARITDPADRTADDFAAHMRTNPFLRELMQTFLRVGGRHRKARGSGIDFDELGVSEVVELLDDANMEAVVRDFGNRNPQEDPVIHFYEHFLSAYDKKQKVKRGVFYTPRPVVCYIVRSVHELLRTEFGLADGLADTTTWAEMSERHEALQIPEGTSSSEPFVQILDPAAGTGTFLVEVIDLIRQTMGEKWRSQGFDQNRARDLWNDYVTKHLLPRLHGYELLMASYAIAHLKISLKLHETGYRFETDERAQVYLTNALELPVDHQFALDFMPALAHEAEAVNKIKRMQQFTVVIGNPPYSGASANMSDDAKKLVDRYRNIDGAPLKERKVWLQNDYVKFIGLAHKLLSSAGSGAIGYITDNSYLDGPTFRGLRWQLLVDFSTLYVLDLGGSTKKTKATPRSHNSENVFDITQGVAVLGAAKGLPGAMSSVNTGTLTGDRFEKYRRLLTVALKAQPWRSCVPKPPFYLLRSETAASHPEYEIFWPVNRCLSLNSVGVQTSRDHVAIAFTHDELINRIRDFSNPRFSDHETRAKFFPGKRVRNYPAGDTRGWKLSEAREILAAEEDLSRDTVPICYRPFDFRYVYNTLALVDWPRPEVSEQMRAGNNIGLCVLRRTENTRGYDYFSISRHAISNHQVSLKDGTYLLPLYIYSGSVKKDLLAGQVSKAETDRTPNFDRQFTKQLAGAAGLRCVGDGRGDLRDTFGPEDILAWIYAVFHSPEYRARYEAHLKLDFPRVPLPGGTNLFRQLTSAGHDLLSFHLLESPALDDTITDYAGPKNPEVGRVGWSDGTVWLDAARTNARQGHRATKPGRFGFHGVPQEVWDFHIGGYQVCHKWLKDRKGRRLSDEDVVHYQRVVVALNETVRVMAEIDEVIDTHGGWPGAFQASGSTEKRPGLLRVAETSPPYNTGRRPKSRDG